MMQKSQNDRQCKARPGSRPGFTLTELLVAIAVMSLLLVLAFQFVGQVTKVWGTVNSRVEQFNDARQGLNSLVLRLSAATLNQYFGYEYTTDRMPVNPGRRSELRFISGAASTVMGSGGARPTHAVFFVAPTGYTARQDYKHLPGLLNIYGYYIEWSNQDPDRPDLLSDQGAAPYRFRLMQLIQPAENMGIYGKTITDYPTFVFRQNTAWQRDVINAGSSSAYPLANNIVALILLPAMSVTDMTGSLTSDYLYDTESFNANQSRSQRNRLPPVMRVILYSIDENSARKIEKSSVMPDLYGGLFTNATRLYPQSGDQGDLARFEAVLDEQKLKYQRHETVVEMLPQPWSTKSY